MVLSTILLAGMLSGALGFGSNDNSVEEDIYKLIKTPVQEVHWSDDLNKLTSITLTNIIDFENNIVWVVDYANGRIIKEADLIAEIENERRANELLVAKLLEERKESYNKNIINQQASESEMTIDFDGNLVFVKTGKLVIDNSSSDQFITVKFNISESTPIDNDYLVAVQNSYKTSDNLSVIGYASPDGNNPKMQIELAFNRMKIIKKELEKLGYKITKSLGVVCPSSDEKSSCWKTVIEVDK